MGDIVIKDTTPKDYEYLLPMDGQTFDKTVYVLLAELYPSGTLPNLNDNRFLEGSTTTGLSKDAGLPNITGTLYIGKAGAWSSGSTASGAFSVSNEGAGNTATYKSGIGTTTEFSAKNSNSIYGKSTTVQPKSYTVRYYVCYA